MSGMKVSVVGDMKEITRDLNALERKTVPAATVAALNKLARKIKTDATKEIAALLQVKAGNIRERIRTRRAMRKYQVATIKFLKAPISAVDEMTPAARQKGLGRPAVGKKGKKKKPGVKAGKHRFPHSFVGTGPGGNILVFERVPPKKMKSKPKKDALEKNVIKVEAGEAVLNKHVRRSGVHFRKLFEHELRWRIQKHGSR